MRVLSVWKAIAMMSHHQARVLAQIFGQAVVRALHGEQRTALRRASSALLLSLRMPSTRFSTSRTLVRYSSSLLCRSS